MSDGVTNPSAAVNKRTWTQGFITIDCDRSFTDTPIIRNPAARPALPVLAIAPASDVTAPRAAGWRSNRRPRSLGISSHFRESTIPLVDNNPNFSVSDNFHIIAG